MRQNQKIDGGGTVFVPSSMMKKIQDSLGWVGQKVSYQRKPNAKNKVWIPVVYDCTGLVLDAKVTKSGVDLFVNCLDHEEHKEMWKRSYNVVVVNEDKRDDRLRPADTDYIGF
jgi:hypothetical protein